MLESVLIANRGEIACRIARTCRRLGIRAIAVFSDADRTALHVRNADEAVHVGPSPAAESYLAVERILDAARRTGAAAVHPGYGFLSESPAFARAVRDAGLVFIGPAAEAMERMGGKASAKRLMQAAGVPLVPGYHDDHQADATLVEAARQVGFPLMIKAVAGGGGRGMRRVDAEPAFADALAACRREATAAFGDDRVLLERVIERPRHVEVQVFADRHGNAVHLFERDCTLQRRHQKVVEEAPAPGLSDELRRALGEAAVAAARAADYENAGTVEFLLTEDGSFHFIEMNTRLQVEHPVTEAVTGLDLVEWQLCVAAGEPLPLRQDQIHLQGHAVEARLYAEDPERGFLPSIGTLHRLDLPQDARRWPGIRVDTGVRGGDVVSPFYDPMIAKVIAQGPDRDAALVLLEAALAATHVEGVATNVAFLRRVLAAGPFRRMTIDTGWLDGEAAAGLMRADQPEPLDRLLAAVAVIDSRTPDRRPWIADRHDPWNLPGAWRLNAPHRQWVRFADGPVAVDTVVDGLIVDGRRVRTGDPRRAPVEIDGHRPAYVARLDGSSVHVTRDGRTSVLALEPDPAAAAAVGADDARLTAPMPGKVTRLAVAAGREVAAGDLLAVLEAMKMEHRFTAPRAGKVAAVHVREGEQVEEGTVLLDLEATP